MDGRSLPCVLEPICSGGFLSDSSSAPSTYQNSGVLALMGLSELVGRLAIPMETKEFLVGLKLCDLWAPDLFANN